MLVGDRDDPPDPAADQHADAIGILCSHIDASVLKRLNSRHTGKLGKPVEPSRLLATERGGGIEVVHLGRDAGNEILCVEQ